MREFLRKLTALLAAAVTLLLCACGAQEAEGGVDLENVPISGTELQDREPVDELFSINYDPEGNMNPIRAENSANMQFWSLLYDSVFSIDEEFHLSSEIIADYSTEDNSWWNFTVNLGYNFSDGSPLTAKDVAYSILVAKQSPYYRHRLDVVYGCSSIDDSRFAISTTAPNSMLPLLLTVPIIRAGDYYEDFPVGSGPYVLSDDHTRLVKNYEYRHVNSLPLDTIYLVDYMESSVRIQAFDDSRLDIVTNDPTSVFSLGYGSTNETRYVETSNMQYIGFNTRSKYFQLFRLRCAVNYIVDRSYITGLMDNCAIPAALPVHPSSQLYDREYADSLGYNKELCQALFEQAGLGDLDNDGDLEVMVTGIVVELHIKFIVNSDSAVKVAAAHRIAEELTSMGITTQVYELGWEDFVTALEEGDYDMYYGEVRMGMDWDLRYLFKVPDMNVQKVDWAMNYAKNTDETYDRLYREFFAASEIGRYDAFQQVAHYIVDTGLIIPVCFERRQVLTHRGVVSGLRATQYDLFYHFYEWGITMPKVLSADAPAVTEKPTVFNVPAATPTPTPTETPSDTPPPGTDGEERMEDS